jgi:hypothetical protein
MRVFWVPGERARGVKAFKAAKRRCEGIAPVGKEYDKTQIISRNLFLIQALPEFA